MAPEPRLGGKSSAGQRAWRTPRCSGEAVVVLPCRTWLLGLEGHALFPAKVDRKEGKNNAVRVTERLRRGRAIIPVFSQERGSPHC